MFGDFRSLLTKTAEVRENFAKASENSEFLRNSELIPFIGRSFSHPVSNCAVANWKTLVFRRDVGGSV